MAKDKAAKDATAAAAEAEEKAKKSADAIKAADIVRPPPQRRSPNGSSPASGASSGSSGDQQRSALQAALAKPINERNGEELVRTGRAGKVRKTESAADDMDLANVRGVSFVSFLPCRLVLLAVLLQPRQ